MNNGSICCICRSEAVQYAAGFLFEWGLPVVQDVSEHVSHLLLPVPSFLRGSEYLEDILPILPPDTVISGGNLDCPMLEKFQTVDFLKDPYYLAANAAITADCAIEIVKNEIGRDLTGCPMLVLGWGRIGKCLGKSLREEGADVTISARKDEDLAMIQALGYSSIPICGAGEDLERYHVILNTVPEMILPEMYTRPDCVIVELASKPGMIADSIISARGLPGKMAPERSGKLIAETFLRLSYFNKEE